jgi:hypothetical protein
MSDANMPNQVSSRSERRPERKLPDPAICRAKHAGFGDYADCLVDAPFECRYVLGFGFHYHCLHPERAEIIARTTADQRSEDGSQGVA